MCSKVCALKVCPSTTVGYVYLPALALIALASMSLAPLGARAAYRVPVKALRVGFRRANQGTGGGPSGRVR